MHASSALQNVWVLQHHTVHTFDMNRIIVLWTWGCNSNEISIAQTTLANTSYIHKGLHAGKSLDQLTSKPDALSTLGYHWTDLTGAIMADAISQWSSSRNPQVICISGTYWKTTGVTSTLECHWDHTSCWYQYSAFITCVTSYVHLFTKHLNFFSKCMQHECPPWCK